MIKAVFFDIDGTLIPFHTRCIPDSTIKALQMLREQGVKLFICSGRPPIQLQLLGEQFNSFPWDGFVLLNGQYCRDGEGNVFHKMHISRETLEVLIPWMKENADFSCMIMELDYSYDIRFNQSTYNYLKDIGKLDQMVPVDDPMRALEHDTYQICPYIPEERDAEFISHAPGLKSQRWTTTFADMVPAQGGKQVGMQKMLEHFGISRKECMAFGDGGNDIPMLEYAEIGVAMGNASDQVKASADYVTDAVNQDGIFNALMKLHILAI